MLKIYKVLLFLAVNMFGHTTCDLLDKITRAFSRSNAWNCKFLLLRFRLLETLLKLLNDMIVVGNLSKVS